LLGFLAVFVFLLAFVPSGFSQILTFEFSALAGNETAAVSNFNDPGLASSTISRGSGLTISGNSGRFNATNWGSGSIENAVTNSKYMEFTITPNSGQQFSVSSITAQWQRSATGNTEIALRSSADNFAADIDSVKPVADTTSTQSFTWTVSQSASATPVTYRFYSFAEAASGSGGPGDGTGNDIVVSGLVSPSSTTAPTITNISPTSGPVGTSVTITGTNFASNATVSFNGTAATSVTFTSPTSLTATVPAGATTGPITVTVGSESGTSSGSFTVVDPLAPLITTTGTFTAFSTTAGNASASQSITVNGTNLTASITATAPTGFEVSSNNSTWGPTATIAQSGGPLFARIASTATTGTLTGNITLASTGAISLSIPVSGTVNAPPSGIPNVVINKFLNSTPDKVELLVVGNGIPGSTLDMRGMIIKDTSGSMANDTGGKFEFATSSIWAAVPAGTLIVITANTNSSSDTDSADFILDVGLTDTALFTSLGSGFDIATTEMVMIKSAGSGGNGTIGGIHALAAGTAGAQFTTFPGYKLISTGTTASGNGTFANNSNSTLADYNGTDATGATPAASLTFGQPNNATNAIFINNLRASSPTAPTITNFTPTSGPVGTSVTITGTNFASNATVSFNGTASTSVTFNSASSLTAIVPAGATTGPISVQSNGENATSSNSFTVTVPGAPTIIPSVSSLGNFTTTNGTASIAQSFTVNGTNLTANITATAPASFEISTVNATSGFGLNATIAQSGGNASGSVFVRLSALAPVGTPSGNILLSSLNATSVNVTVNGTVSSPQAGAPIVSGASFSGTVGVLFPQQTVNATNGPNTFSASPGMPAGLTLNATTGVISGTPTAAGNPTILITATNNASLSGNASFNFNIANGTPVITTPPSATPIRVGQALSNSTLSGGVASVPGTFAFTTPSTVPTTTGNQSVTFTPTDSANYNNATTNVTVTVNPAPAINVTPGNLTGFSTKQNAASANQTITVNGTDLEGVISINASAGYEISSNGANYSPSLVLAPNQQSSSPVARAATIIASDSASNYGNATSNTWGNGANAGTGFLAWSFNVVANSSGTPPPAFYAGAFIGDPSAAGITNMPSPAFGLYANPGGTNATVTVSRNMTQPLAVGDSFSFQWATNWDSETGNKGFNIFVGGNQVVNVNQAGLPGNITCNDQLAIEGSSGYGTQPMTWTFTRTTASNLLVTTTDRKGGSAVVYSSNVTISGGPDRFSFYATAMKRTDASDDQRQPYFNNFQITSSGPVSGNLTNTTVYVRLAAGGTPNPATTGNLTLSSSNATSKVVTLSGEVLPLTEPVITSRTINGTVGTALTEPINATSNLPITNYTSTGTLPPGVSFNATTGIFSGTPTTAGSYPVTVTATNADGIGNGTLSFVIAKGTPAITTQPTASTIFSGQTLANSILSGGIASVPGSFAFTAPSTAPPIGSALQSVTFTPTDTANWNTASTNVTVSVSSEPPGPPEFPSTPITDISGDRPTVGLPLFASANITNGPTSYSGNLPDGLTLNPLTGQITGTPYAAGNFTVPITATNSKGTTSGNLTFDIAKGTPFVVTNATVTLYPDETLAATTPEGALANIAGDFVFANPALAPSNGEAVDVVFTPYDLANWRSVIFQFPAQVVPLPVYGLTISQNLNEILEGDPYSEARIRITHNGTTSRSVTVNFTATLSVLQGDMSGNLSFVNFPASATIPAGSNSTAFFVRAINDQSYTGNRFVTLSGTGRFLGNVTHTVNMTILEDDTAFTEWSNGLPPAPELIRDYAIGGAILGQQGQLPVLGMNATHMSLDALVRTNDPKLTYHGEWTTDLRNGSWTPVLLQTPTSQTSFGNLLFSIPRTDGETKKFLRLKVTLDE
jgi:hypothetical protein